MFSSFFHSQKKEANQSADAVGREMLGRIIALRKAGTRPHIFCHCHPA